MVYHGFIDPKISIPNTAISEQNCEPKGSM